MPLIALFFVGCQGLPKELAERVSVSARGVLLESLVPKDDTWMFASVSTKNRESFANVERLWNRVVGDAGPAMAQVILGKLLDQNASFDISRFADALKQGSRVAVAATEQTNAQGFFEINYYALIELPDENLAQAIHDQLRFQNVAVARRNDVLVVSSTERGIEVIENLPARKSFARNKQYLELLGRVETDFAYVVSTHQPLSVINQYAPTAGAELPTASKISRGSALFVVPEKNGFRFDGFTALDPEELKKIGMERLLQPQPLELIAEAPTARTILANEGFGLDLGLQQLFGAPLAASLQSFKEVLPLVRNHSLITLQDTGSLVPGIELWIDAEEDEAAREAAIDALDRLFGTLQNYLQLRFGQNATNGASFIETEQLEGRRAIITTFHFDALPKETVAELPLLRLFGDTLEATYGVTNEGNIFIAFSNDFAERLAALQTGTQTQALTLEDDPLYRDLLSRIENYHEANLLYINGATFMDAAERLLTFIKDNAYLSAQEYEFYKTFRRHATPLRGFIQGTRREGNSIFTRGYLLIQ